MWAHLYLESRWFDGYPVVSRILQRREAQIKPTHTSPVRRFSGLPFHVLTFPFGRPLRIPVFQT